MKEDETLYHGVGNSGVTSLRCILGIHNYQWSIVMGSSIDFRKCTRCNRVPYEDRDKYERYVEKTMESDQ